MDLHVPFIDYSAVSKDLKKEILIEIGRVMQLKNEHEHELYVAGVEKKLAWYFHAGSTIAVDSGTTALQLVLAAYGVSEEDEVIVPAYTYAATALAVTNLGARPVFADIKPGDLTIDPDHIESLVTSRTRAVVAVHVHGFCCDMGSIRRICVERGLALVEDASQAHGATIGGQKAGTFGIGCFSLHTSKNLGGIGDAGLIVLSDEAMDRRIREFLVPDGGGRAALESRRTPCGMDAVQAAIVSRKLTCLDELNETKRGIARQYDALLADPDIKKPQPLKGSVPVYRDYFILVEDRQAVKSFLAKEGVETKFGYTPLHLTRTFEGFVKDGTGLPVAEMVAEKVLLLPCFGGMTDVQLKQVCAVMRLEHART